MINILSLLTTYLFVCLNICTSFHLTKRISPSYSNSLKLPMMTGVPSSPNEDAAKELNKIIIAAASLVIAGIPMYAAAASGSIKASTKSESIIAVNLLNDCLAKINDLEQLAKKNDWNSMGNILSVSPFTNLESACSILVRSESLTQEDKVSLGTIKRYGIVADALIMQGGLIAELRSGGINIPGESKNDIGSFDEDQDDSSDDVTKVVNASEVKKYLKLFKDSIADICKIANSLR